MVMDRYAECFRGRGLAVLAFDHRGHGSSDGEPRGEINYWVQARGYIDAIGAARAMTDLEARGKCAEGAHLGAPTAGAVGTRMPATTLSSSGPAV